jgi:hypothetical protein
MSARTAAVALLAAALAACAPAPRAPVTSLDSIGRDEVVLVGRVEIVPPLRKDEQKIGRNVIGGNIRDHLFLMAGDQPRPLRDDPRIAEYAGRIEAPLSATFFVRSEAKPFYINGGLLILEMGGSSVQRVYFPGGLRVDIKPGDRAVYVGTLRYTRDEFFEIKRTQVVDEHREASKQFAAKFGSGTALRKALLTPVR